MNIIQRILKNFNHKTNTQLVNENTAQSALIQADTTLPPHIQTQRADVDAKALLLSNGETEKRTLLAAYRAKVTQVKGFRKDYILSKTKEIDNMETYLNYDGQKYQKYDFEYYNEGHQPPVGTMPKVHNLTLTIGDFLGVIQAHWDGNLRESNFIVEWTYDDPLSPETLWEYDVATASTYDITGLVSGRRLYVRVAAHGTDGNGPWSDHIDRIVP